jgi:hypothetical protein
MIDGVVQPRIGDESRGGRVAYYLIAYAAWLVAAALTAVVGYDWHYIATNLYIELRLNRWAFQLFASSAALGLAIAWLILVVFLEHWLSSAGSLVRLRQRVVRLAISGLAALAVSHLAATYLVTRHI